METERIETRAVTFAEGYYESIGWAVKNVSRVRGSHAGYDLFLERGGEKLMVEVKGCSRLFQIPDLYVSEIDAATQMLIADELCVVYFLPGEDDPQLARIPRRALDPQYIVPKLGYRISGRFKNERIMKRFMIDPGARDEGSETRLG